MKKFLLMFITAIMCMPLMLNAQFTATFGTGTSATTTGGNAGAPMSYGGAYSWCQQIYRAAELTAANVPPGAVILSISFYNATGATTMSDIRTYMGHRTSDYFSGTSDWAPFNTLTLVDSGDWVAPAGWFDVNLDAPFVWDGTSNIVVGVSFRGAHSDYSTNNPNCGYQYTTQSGNAHIRRYSTTLSSCDPTSTAAANSVSSNRPNLKITYIVSGCASLTPSVANIGPYSADLNWFNFQQSVSSWDLLYGEAGTFDTLSGGNTVTGVTDTFYNLTGLTAGTMYQVYMKPYCSSEVGTWSAPRTFTTLAACPTPVNLTLMSHTAEEATITWLPGATETGWEVACVPHGSPVYSVTPQYANSYPYTITNLIDNTHYDVYVRADCGTGEYSYWTSAVSFTTDPYCTEPTNVHATQIQATSALITWNSAPVGATGYTVGYSEAGQGNWTTQPVTGTLCMLSGLTPNTNYDVFVHSECDQGDADSVFKNFATQCLSGGDPFTDGTISTYDIPLNNYWEYSYTQQIFLASEMGGAATIDSIAFYYNYSTPSSVKSNVTIYLGHTTQSTFSSTSNYIPFAGLQQVYTGPMNCSQGWNTFVFTTPFQYNGSDNLVLVIDDNSGDYDGSAYVFLAHDAGATRTVHYYNDGTDIAPSNPTSTSPNMSTTTDRSNVKFFIPCDNTVTCLAPNIYVSEFTDETITINWAPGYMESSWELEYSEDGSTWTSEGTVTTSPYIISNLTSNTLYYIRLRSICGGDYSNWAQVTHRTACADMATLPFMENFDSYTGATTTSVSTNNLPYCWSFLNEGTSTSYSGYPIIYASATYAASGSNSIRFYTYTTAGTYDDQIAILPPIDTDVNPMNTLQLVLDARALSTSYMFNLDVGIMSDPTDRNTFVTLQTIQTQNTTYANYEIPFSQYTGTGKYIALRASQPTTGYNYGYVDNVRVEPIPECPKPTNVTSTVVTTNSVTLGWTEVGTATSWVITYGPTGFTPGTSVAMTETVYDNPYTITGLNSSTGYDFYVQSDCGSSYSNMSNVYTTATQCDLITALPLMENFDSYAGSTTTSVSVNNLPYCWSNHNTGTSTSYSGYPMIYASATYAASGNNSMRFYTYTTSGTYSDQVAILPEIDVNTFPMNTLQLSFDARALSTSYTFSLVVGVMTDPTVASSFTPVQTLNITSTAYNNFEVPFTSYTGTGGFIALKATQPTSGYNYGYVDNIVVDIAPLCAKPTNVTASNITATGADINWMPGGNETDWELVVVPAGMNITTGTPEPVSTHPYTLTNLNDNTSYDVYVRADCGTGTDFSSWSQACHFTTTPWCSAPTDVEVTQLAGTSALLTWTPAVFGATGYTVSYTETGMNNWITQSVTGDNYMLTGLTPETAYTLTITSECDQGTAPTVTKTFTTPCLYGGTAQIGNGTTTTYQLPLNNFYNYSYTQQIYLASELNGPATISNIAFEYSYTTASTSKSNVSIYLGHTNKTSFSSATDYENPTNLQLVYTGPMNCQQGWNTFNFTNAFSYNGTDNLVVAIDDNSGSYNGSSYTFYAHDAGATRSLYFYSDSYNMDPANPGGTSASNSTTSNRNNIKISLPCDYTITCIAPNVYVSDATENSITLNWAPGNNESSWELEMAAGDTNWVSQGTVTSAPYTVNNLNPNTLYNFRLRSVCGGGEYSNWALVSHRTDCAPIATLPYSENFDSYSGATTTSMAVTNLPYCWTNINEGTSTSYSGYPIIYSSSSYAASGSNSMRFYSYTTAGTYDDQIAVLPAIDVTTNPMNTLQLTFDARNNSTYTFTLEIGIMTDPTNVATFVPINTIVTTSNTYANYEIPFNQYTGSGAYIALRAPQPTSSYNSGYVDNIVVELIPSCPKPQNLTAQNVTTNSVDLSWTEVGSATTWEIAYGAPGFDPDTTTNIVTATSNPYTVSGLNNSSTYEFYVRAICGGSDISQWGNKLTTSTTMVPTDLPYATDFTDPNDAWILNNGNCTSQWVKGTYNGSGAMFVSTDGTTPGYDGSNYAQISAQKLFTVGADQNVTITFDVTVNGESSFDFFKLFLAPASQQFPASNASLSSSDYGYNSYSTNAYNFYSNGYGTQSSYPYVLNLVSGTIHVTATMPNPNANPDANSTALLVLAWRNDGSVTNQPPAIIQNLTVGDITCVSPTGITASNISTTSADLSWTPGGTETSWSVEYKESTASTWTTATVTSPSYQLTGLTATTLYNVRVKALCSATDESFYSNYTFATANCDLSSQCSYTFVLGDGYGDGWNDGYLTVEQNGVVVATVEAVNHNLSSTQTYDTVTVNLCDNISTSLVWHTGSFDDEISITLIGPDGTQLYTIDGLDMISSNTLFTFTTDCSGSGPVPTDPTVATNAASAVEQTSATLHGTITNPDNVTITAKGFQWKATQGGTYTSVTGTGTGNTFTADLTNLTPNTSYTFKAFITFNGTTVEGSEMTFMTLQQGVEPCDMPTGLHTTDIQNESISIAWDANPAVVSWNIQYKPVGGTLSSATSTTNSYTITGLVGNTDYEIQVQANCGDGNVSDWTATIPAHTDNVGIENWLENNVTLFPNPAKEYVDIRVDGDLNVTTMEVYDVYGKLINTVNVIDNPTRINVNGLANGMYFVRVTTEKGVVTKTFVKK